MRIAARAIFLALLIIFATSKPIDSQTQRSTPCGKYQLFEGTTFFGGTTVNLILRVDTQTGQAWVYVAGTNDLLRQGGWYPIQEFKLPQ